MTGRFGHLRSVVRGDRDAFVSVSLSGYTPPKHRGWVDPGRYAADVTDSEWVPAQSGQGVNLHNTLRTVLPADFAGIVIEDWIYIPFDDVAGDAKIEQLSDIAYSKTQHLLRSITTAEPGKFESLQQPGKDGKPKVVAIGPSKIIGKRLFVEVEAGSSDAIGRDGRTRDFSDTSKVRWYIGREDFEAQPGPAKQAPRSGAEQVGKPELRAGNGDGARPIAQASAKGQASVDDLIDF